MPKKLILICVAVCLLVIIKAHSQTTEPVRVDESTDNLQAPLDGWTKVLGEVVNGSSHIIGRVRITITLKDATGKILGTSFTYADGKNVEIDGRSNDNGIFPGERAPFSNSFSDVELTGVAKVEYIVTYDIADPRTDTNQTSIVTRIADLETATTSQGTKITKIETDIKTLQDSVPQKDPQTKLNTDAIKALQTATGGQTSNQDLSQIQKNRTSIDSLGTKINSLDTSLKNIPLIQENRILLNTIKTRIDSLINQPNNSSNSIIGDLDVDGDVDFQDFILFAQAFGSKA
jgi:hypothetical protein